ncbi:MAG: flagellar assembly factor FliW [Chthoniobacter sp.]|jgi:flagellar assembly factor FliW|nr:flagellar assembly factor FliW [Chthoniobacter sp.]
MMILEAETTGTRSLDPGARIRLPAGMVGLPEATEFELVTSEDSLPLMWLRSTGAERLSFPVVEPGPFVPNYELELNDADAEILGAAALNTSPLVLTVLTVKSMAPQKATINLIGPIVINRQTLVGKQVLLANYERYSVEHPIIDETAEVGTC